MVVAQSVELSWSPSEETNLSHYHIYRSPFDQSDFVLLGWAGEKDSTFLDEAVQSEIPYYYAATVVLQDGRESAFSNIVKVVIPDDAHSMVGISMDQNYPNPFNAITNINFVLNQSQWINMEVYDVRGRKISTLMNQYLNAGEHRIVFDGNNLNNGVYFINIKAGAIIKTIKIILLK